MKCPSCGQVYFCPCKACEVNFPNDVPKFKIVNKVSGDDWDEQCPKCGYTQSVHWWFDEEFRQYEALKEKEGK